MEQRHTGRHTCLGNAVVPPNVIRATRPRSDHSRITSRSQASIPISIQTKCRSNDAENPILPVPSQNWWLPVELRRISQSRRGSGRLAAGPLLLLLLFLLLFLLLCFSSNAFHPAPADVDEGGDHDADDHQQHGLGEVVFVIVPPASDRIEIIFRPEVTFAIGFGLPALPCPLGEEAHVSTAMRMQNRKNIPAPDHHRPDPPGQRSVRSSSAC